MITVTFIRHGQTPGNVRKAYSGSRTEESLTQEGEAALRQAAREGLYPEEAALYVSPMLRCLLTAAILYPGRDACPVPGLRECDFGDFEGRNYEELKDVPAYQSWLDSGGTLAFPGGESMLSFQDRCCSAFEAVLMQEAAKLQETAMTQETAERNLVFVVHGGTIMALMGRYGTEGKSYFEYQVGNGEGYICELVFPGEKESTGWGLSLLREIRL